MYTQQRLPTMSANERLHYGLDRYEQMESAADLEDVLSNRPLDTLVGYTHAQLGESFSLAHEHSVADEASDFLSGNGLRHQRFSSSFANQKPGGAPFDFYAPDSLPPPERVATDKRYVGAYSPKSRRRRIDLFNEKRKNRVWTRKVKYDVRKNFADTRMRVKGRFVKKEDEDLLKELICII